MKFSCFHFSVFCWLFLFGTVDFSHPTQVGYAEPEAVQSVTPTTQATAAPNLTPVSDKKVQEHKEPTDPDLLYSKTGAKIAFLVFLALFIGVYFVIRRQPTQKSIKKKQKRKF